MIRRLLVLFIALTFAAPAFAPRTASACECFDDEGNSSTIAADAECWDACSANGGGFEAATGDGICECGDGTSAEVSCSNVCDDASLLSEPPTSDGGDTSTAAAGTATSDSISYIAVSQSTYFAQLQARGITFAYVSTKCETTGECTLEDIMQVFTNIANFILGIVGSLTLIIFVYGGFLWLTSQGSSEKIEQGKTAMTGSVIGLLIVFGAFSAINLLTGAIRGGTPGQTNYCELVSPAEGGKAGTGYACLDTTGLNTTTDYTCEDNLCPGGESIKCCIKK